MFLEKKMTMNIILTRILVISPLNSYGVKISKSTFKKIMLLLVFALSNKVSHPRRKTSIILIVKVLQRII